MVDLQYYYKPKCAQATADIDDRFPSPRPFPAVAPFSYITFYTLPRIPTREFLDAKEQANE